MESQEYRPIFELTAMDDINIFNEMQNVCKKIFDLTIHTQREILEDLNYFDARDRDRDKDQVQTQKEITSNSKQKQQSPMIKNKSEYVKTLINQTNLLKNLKKKKEIKSRYKRTKQDKENQNIKQTDKLKESKKYDDQPDQIRQETQDNKFQCVLCNKYYVTKSGLKKHQNKHHVEQQTQRQQNENDKRIRHKCEICGLSYRHYNDFINHQMMDHKQNVIKIKIDH